MSAIDERLMTSVVITEEGCWLRGGYIQSNGYTKVRSGGKLRYAHIVSYELFVGPVPPGHDVDHQCHNDDETCAGGFTCKHRRCINPEHLVARTRGDNNRFGRGNGNAEKTHCKWGHEYTEENTGRTKNGHRRCRTCHNEESRRRWRACRGTSDK